MPLSRPAAAQRRIKLRKTTSPAAAHCPAADGPIPMVEQLCRDPSAEPAADVRVPTPLQGDWLHFFLGPDAAQRPNHSRIAPVGQHAPRWTPGPIIVLRKRGDQ